MPTRSAKADWHGSIQEGEGHLHMSIGEHPYSARTRFDEAHHPTTNPEELIAAAQAACYNMALSVRLNSQKIIPELLETTCKVILTPSGLGFKISRIVISVHAKIPNMSAEDFKEHAKIAKETCPVSSALVAVPFTLETSLAE
jgi:osmotically inducible protein OsmC